MLMAHSIEIIQKIEQSRLDALVAGDIKALDRLLSDSLVFVHPTSKVDTKASYISALIARNPYVAINPVEQTIVVHGDVAVVTGETHTLALRDPPEQNVTRKIRMICVWALEGGDWRVIRYQSTFIP
jgi:ketosteroid isomerase-like protein